MLVNQSFVSVMYGSALSLADYDKWMMDEDWTRSLQRHSDNLRWKGGGGGGGEGGGRRERQRRGGGGGGEERGGGGGGGGGEGGGERRRGRGERRGRGRGEGGGRGEGREGGGGGRGGRKERRKGGEGKGVERKNIRSKTELIGPAAPDRQWLLKNPSYARHETLLGLPRRQGGLDASSPSRGGRVFGRHDVDLRRRGSSSLRSQGTAIVVRRGAPY